MWNARIILEQHDTNNAPQTYKFGKDPIDGLFATPLVQCVGAGYCGFDEGVQSKRSEHRCLWFDVVISTIFGHKMPPIIRPPARRVKCNDPRIVNRFNDLYLHHLVEHKLHQRAFALEIQASYPLAPTLQKEAEDLDLLRMDDIKHADRQCRKLQMGGIPFSFEF
jgi:hypothetical protein